MKLNRAKVHEIIFEADTPEGKLFDVLLIGAIVISVLAVMLDSVATYQARFHMLFITLEYTFTVLFTIEYFLRIYAVKRPIRYIFSFFGIIDLLSVLPTYLALIIPGAHSLLIIRVFRLLRVFRVLKLSRYHYASHYLFSSLRDSRHKIFVFLSTVLTIVIIMGAFMHLIEGPEAGFVDIPTGIYWAIVTITTVGFGDIVPLTPLGQFMSSLLMIIGYSIIAVPTGIITVEMSRKQTRGDVNTIHCPNCSKEGHDSNAYYCKFCGHRL
jgi:voltage-gated potassium channel